MNTCFKRTIYCVLFSFRNVGCWNGNKTRTWKITPAKIRRLAISGRFPLWALILIPIPRPNKFHKLPAVLCCFTNVFYVQTILGMGIGTNVTARYGHEQNPTPSIWRFCLSQTLGNPESYIYIYIHIYVHVYIYIERERGRDIACIYVYIYIYIYTCIYTYNYICYVMMNSIT